MNPTISLLLDALNDGLNKKLLLEQLQMPDDIFRDKVDTDGFDSEEARLINKIIKEWRRSI